RFELPPRNDQSLTADGQCALDEAISAVRASKAEIVLLCMPWSDSARYEGVRDRLRALPLPALLLPDRCARSILAQPMIELVSGFAIEFQRTPLTLFELAIKRVFDVAIASTLLITLSPLLVLVSILIKMSSAGPVIFRQHRRGFNGRPFTIY